MITVCVPVLKRYDLLRGLLLSLEKSTKRPRVVVIDNGQDAQRLKRATEGIPIMCLTANVDERMGVAESWNWFIDHVPQERIIANDDVIFAPDSIEKMVESNADLAWAKDCGFSCFLLRDRAVDVIGRFDEDISPGYGYYEDEDYLQRIDGRGTRTPAIVIENVDAGIVHLKSQTMVKNTQAEMQEHHRRFRIAQQNYMKKWGLKTL